MRIALIGYGKMGKAIEEIALDRGHEIVLKIDESNLTEFNRSNIEKADVAIEFTGPHSAEGNIKKAIELGIPLVCGSTGWTDKMKEIQEFVKAHDGAFLYASNYSVGVNIFFEINKKLATLMKPHKEYDVTIEEIHHTQKKDAPSGTAITLAEQVIENSGKKKTWFNGTKAKPDELLITSKRIDPAPGTHTVSYSSPVDTIDIIHTAHNRQGFALGAVLAAEFLAGKKGIYGMKDVLGL